MTAMSCSRSFFLALFFTHSAQIVEPLALALGDHPLVGAARHPTYRTGPIILSLSIIRGEVAAHLVELRILSDGLADDEGVGVS